MSTANLPRVVACALGASLLAGGCGPVRTGFDASSDRTTIPASDGASGTDVAHGADATSSRDVVSASDVVSAADVVTGRDAGGAVDSGMGPVDSGRDDAASAGDGSVAAGGIRVTNISATAGMFCTEAFWADPPENGDLAVVRLTPPSYPFTVTRVHYYSVSAIDIPGAPCDPRVAHQVRLFVSSGNNPPASPDIAREFAVAETTGSRLATREINVTVDPPLTLTAGDQLFVGIEMVNDALGDAVCLSSCTMGHVDRNFWSAASTAPFPWERLVDWGVSRDPWIEAWGTSP